MRHSRLLGWMNLPVSNDIGVAQLPLPAEVLGSVGLEIYAQTLAAANVDVATSGAGDGLADRLRDNRRVLRVCYAAIAEEVRHNKRITPAAEWPVFAKMVANTRTPQRGA